MFMVMSVLRWPRRSEERRARICLAIGAPNLLALIAQSTPGPRSDLAAATGSPGHGGGSSVTIRKVAPSADTDAWQEWIR